MTTPDNVPTYLTRLASFGLVEFGAEEENLSTQYEILAADDLVRSRPSARVRRSAQPVADRPQERPALAARP